MSIELIEHNPLLKKPTMTVLSICSARANIGREELERQAISQWADTFRQSPSTVIGVLSRHALIEEQMFMNGYFASISYLFPPMHSGTFIQIGRAHV